METVKHLANSIAPHSSSVFENIKSCAMGCMHEFHWDEWLSFGYRYHKTKVFIVCSMHTVYSMNFTTQHATGMHVIHIKYVYYHAGNDKVRA